MYMENGIDYIASYVCRTIMINFVELCKYVGVYIYTHNIHAYFAGIYPVYLGTRFSLNQGLDSLKGTRRCSLAQIV